MDSFPRGHPIFSKNSGEMLKIRPEPQISLQRTQSNYEVPILLGLRNAARNAPRRTEPILSLHREGVRSQNRRPEPVVPTTAPRTDPEENSVMQEMSDILYNKPMETLPIQVPKEPVIQERQAPVFKAMGGEEEENSTSGSSNISKSTPKSITIPAFVVQPGFKSEGGDNLAEPTDNLISELVVKSGFKSEGGNDQGTIPDFVPRFHFKEGEGAQYVEPTVATETQESPEAVDAPNTTESGKTEYFAPFAQEISLVPDAVTTLDPKTEAQPTDAATDHIVSDILSIAAFEKTLQAPQENSARDEPEQHQPSLSDLCKKLIEEACAVTEEPQQEQTQESIAQSDSNFTLIYPEVSGKPEGELEASAAQPVQSSAEYVNSGNQAPTTVDFEPKDGSAIEVYTEQDSIEIKTVEKSLEQKSDYLQLEETLPKEAVPVLEAPQEESVAQDASVDTSAENIQIQNMDLLYDQVSYYKEEKALDEPEEPAKLTDPVAVADESSTSEPPIALEPVASEHVPAEPIHVALEPELVAPALASLKNEFEEFTHDTVARENTYQLTDDERKNIEENNEFFESKQDEVQIPQELNPIASWHQQMIQGHNVPAEEPVMSPVPETLPQDLGSPEMDSLIADFDVLEEEEIHEAEKQEIHVPETM